MGQMQRPSDYYSLPGFTICQHDDSIVLGIDLKADQESSRLTGYYLFGAAKQISIGELWFSQVKLHFMYNLIVFMPLLFGLILYFQPPVEADR